MGVVIRKTCSQITLSISLEIIEKLNVTLGDLEKLYQSGYTAELNNGCCINIVRKGGICEQKA